MRIASTTESSYRKTAVVATSAKAETATPGDRLIRSREDESVLSSLAHQMGRRVKEDGMVMLGGAALFAGIGGAVGSLVGAPGTGAIKGLEVLGVMALASEVMENPLAERKIFNWSKVMGPDPIPADIDSQSTKGKALFAANMATNVAVVAGLGAGIGAVLGGTTGAAVGAGAIFILGAFGERLTR